MRTLVHTLRTALNAGRAPSPALNVEPKTYVEDAAVLRHPATIHRHGVRWFPHARAATA